MVREEYLYDSQHHIIGTVKKECNNKQVVYDKYYTQLGHYDGNKDQTYDSYGKLIGEGNYLSDLPYVPHKLRFPLPEMDRISFTIHRIKRERRSSSVRTSSLQYWDDGRCQICTKNGKRTCLVQGLPGMCETCYRFFWMYSRTDSFELERQSMYRPITVQQIRQAVEKEKAPFLLAAQAADKVAKAALIRGVKEVFDEVNDSTTDSDISEMRDPQRMVVSNNHTAVVATPEKKKRRLRWYHWLFIVIMFYILFNYILPLIVIYILWEMGCI